MLHVFGAGNSLILCIKILNCHYDVVIDMLVYLLRQLCSIRLQLLDQVYD